MAVSCNVFEKYCVTLKSGSGVWVIEALTIR